MHRHQFGPDKGGSVDDNVERWAKQMGAAPAFVERTSRTVRGMKVTRIEVAGTYTPMAMPSIPPCPPRPGYRLVGDIVEAPSGLWFFKLTAPDATAKAAGKDLDKLIDSLAPPERGAARGGRAVATPAGPRPRAA